MKTTDSTFSHLVWLVVMMLLSSCATAPAVAPLVDGEVVSLYAGTTRYIADQALQGARGTQIFYRENLIVFSRYLADGWAFVVVDSNVQAAVTQPDKVGASASLVNLRTWNEFKDFLLANGWQTIAPGIVSAWQWLVNMANNAMPTFYMVPAGFDYTQQELDRLYGGADQ